MIFQPLRRRGTARSRIRTYWPSVAAAAEGTRTASTAGRRRGARTSSAPCRVGASASTRTYTPSRCSTPPPSSARLAASSCRPPHPPALHPTQARAHEPSPRRARAHGRAGAPSRWEIDAAAADPPLRVLTIKLNQQYEAPAARCGYCVRNASGSQTSTPWLRHSRPCAATMRRSSLTS